MAAKRTRQKKEGRAGKSAPRDLAAPHEQPRAATRVESDTVRLLHPRAPWNAGGLLHTASLISSLKDKLREDATTRGVTLLKLPTRNFTRATVRLASWTRRIAMADASFGVLPLGTDLDAVVADFKSRLTVSAAFRDILGRHDIGDSQLKLTLMGLGVCFVRMLWVLPEEREPSPHVVGALLDADEIDRRILVLNEVLHLVDPPYRELFQGQDLEPVFKIGGLLLANVSTAHQLREILAHYIALRARWEWVEELIRPSTGGRPPPPHGVFARIADSALGLLPERDRHYLVCSLANEVLGVMTTPRQIANLLRTDARRRRRKSDAPSKSSPV